MERVGWCGADTEEAVLRKAEQKVRDLIADYRKPEVDPGLLAKLRRAVERAKKEV